VSGATLENFDEPTLPSILTLSGAYVVSQTQNPLTFALPYFSGSTAAFFGETPATGPDGSQFIGILGGSATATFSFPSPQHYFGILWGSIDTANNLTFYDSANAVIGTMTGANILSLTGGISGDQGVNGTAYVNITSTVAFSSVVASCPNTGFEFDDVAYAQLVPEPTTSILFCGGFCLLGFAFRRTFTKSESA
jgi:hypothetical protein